MRILTAAVVGALLCRTAVTLAQDPRAENFGRFRTTIIDRFERNTSQLESKGVDTARLDSGKRLDPNVSAAFGLPNDVRVVKAAEIVFPDGRRLTFAVSTNTTDIVLGEAKAAPDGTSLLMAFHTDPTLALRGAASGADTNTLRPVPIDGDAASAFRNVLIAWDRVLPNMLEQSLPK
jgi:hypothetical protein